MRKSIIRDAWELRPEEARIAIRRGRWEAKQIPAMGVDRASRRVAGDAPPAGPAGQNIFRREGEFWTIAYGGITVRLKDTKGLRYIACLLEHPGEEIHVHDLIAIVEGMPTGQIAGDQTASGQALGLEIVSDLGDAGDTLDFRARADYHRRLLEVREELGDAQRQNDTGRAETARSELFRGYCEPELCGCSYLVAVRLRD